MNGLTWCSGPTLVVFIQDTYNGGFQFVYIFTGRVQTVTACKSSALELLEEEEKASVCPPLVEKVTSLAHMTGHIQSQAEAEKTIPISVSDDPHQGSTRIHPSART